MKGRTAVKRSFKVATAFTGVAACATVMAPAADAAVPLTAMNCTAALGHWVHLGYSKNQHHITDACFGNNGWNYLTNGQKFSSLCTGNNWGRFIASGTQIYWGPSFLWPFSHPMAITALYISGHAGNFSCH